jgi:hypothetical protein
MPRFTIDLDQEVWGRLVRLGRRVKRKIGDEGKQATDAEIAEALKRAVVMQGMLAIETELMPRTAEESREDNDKARRGE